MGNAAQKESEIIIKNNVEDMAKLFVKEHLIIWHDPNIDSPENSDYIQDLRMISEVKTFSKWKDASSYVQSIEKVCNIITSGKDGEILVKDIESKSHVLGFYIFCGNIEFHSQWSQYYAKVMCVEDNMNNILSKLKKVLLEWQREESSSRVIFPAFAPIFDDMDKSENNYLHLKLKGLVNFKNREQAKHDFISLSQIIYNEESHIKDIKQFQKEYNEYKMAKVFEWYTRDCFLYKMLNNCLRIATSDSIQYCRLILKDLETAIKEQYQLKSHRFNGLLYRGTYLSEKEWKVLQENIGKDIEMYGFLSTSKLKSVGEEFVLKGHTSSKALITILVPGCPNDGEQGFAEIKEFSDFMKEEEILFNVRSRFTILETGNEMIEGREFRHLVLLYGARIWRQHLSETTKRYQFEFNVECEKTICCQCNKEAKTSSNEMFFADLKEEGSKYFCQTCLPKNGPFLCLSSGEPRIMKLRGKVMSYSDFDLPFYGYACAECQTTKSKWYYTCVDCQGESKEVWCSECIHQNQTCLKSAAGHAVILETAPFSFCSEKLSEDELNHIQFQNQLVGDDGLFQQANIFYDCNELDKAKEFYKRFIELREKNPSDEEDQVELAVSYNNLGLICGELGEYKAALENHFKALEIKEQESMKDHLSIARSHNNIGSIYQSLKEYQRSIEHHNKALNIRLSIYKEPHAETAASYNNLGFVYERSEAYNKSLQLYFTAYNMDKAVYGEKHAMTAKSLNSLGSIYLKLRDYEKAMECQTRALEIRRTVFGEKHADTATSYTNLGILYMEMRDYEKSLGYHFKALSILILLYQGESHSDIANAYNNLGLVYQKMEDFGKSLEFLLKAVALYKSIHGEQHSDTAASLSEVGLAYHNLEDHQKALEYHLKALEILAVIYGEGHSEVATSYRNLGCVYDSLKEYKMALEYHLRGLELYQKIYGENHESTATSHDYLGLMYKDKGEYKKALDHLEKALQIRTLIYKKEDSHPSIASSFNNIGIVYKNLGDNDLSMKNHEKALEMRKRIFGEKHPETAISFSHLGLVYKNLGKYEKSLEYHMKALEIREEAHKEGDSDTADSCHNIGLIYFNQRNFEKSLEYLAKAQNIHQRIYGDTHPITLESVSEYNFVLSQFS